MPNIEFRGLAVTDIPSTGYYVTVNAQDNNGNITKKAILVDEKDLHENKSYCTLNYKKADRDGNMKGVFIASEAKSSSDAPKTEPKEDPKPDTPSEKPKAAWTVDITSPENTPGTDFDISKFFTDEQKSVMTDDNTAGANADGVDRKIHVYFLGTTEKAASAPYELPWVENAGEKNDKVFNDMKALGFTPSFDAPLGGYTLDSSLDLQMDYTNKAYKIRVTYEP